MFITLWILMRYNEAEEGEMMDRDFEERQSDAEK
jgi:hypothetical protein